MNAGQMGEALKNKYPMKFSIPGETEIKSHIGAQFQKSKYNKKSNGSGRGRRAATDKPNWHYLVEICVEEDPTGKPEDIYKTFVEKLEKAREMNDDVTNTNGNIVMETYDDVPVTNGTIDKRTVKQKIGQHRQKLRKEAMMNTLFSQKSNHLIKVNIC